MPNNVLPKFIQLRLVDESEHGNDVLVLWLGDELCDGPDNLEGALSVCYAHCAIHPVHCVEHTGVIEPIGIRVNRFKR